MTNFHTPVLLNQVVEYLNPLKGKWYIDATLGGGGYSKAILEKGACVLGIDQDPEAIEYATNNLSEFVKEGTVKIAQGNFAEIEEIAKENKIEEISGVVFDLGVSSHQLDTNRGFSFRREEALDMRMSKIGISAKEIVNTFSEDELTYVFQRYGEEHFARKIALAVVNSRKNKKIDTTKELADIVLKSIPRGKVHPATKIFQALRILVNDELKVLEEGLSDAFELVETNGRVVVVSFHSLEDRIVKRMFTKWEQEKKGRMIAEGVVADEAEVELNPRSRSGKLRCIEKI